MTRTDHKADDRPGEANEAASEDAAAPVSDGEERAPLSWSGGRAVNLPPAWGGLAFGAGAPATLRTGASSDTLDAQGEAAARAADLAYEGRPLAEAEGTPDRATADPATIDAAEHRLFGPPAADEPVTASGADGDAEARARTGAEARARTGAEARARTGAEARARTDADPMGEMVHGSAAAGPVDRTAVPDAGLSVAGPDRAASADAVPRVPDAAATLPRGRAAPRESLPPRETLPIRTAVATPTRSGGRAGAMKRRERIALVRSARRGAVERAYEPYVQPRRRSLGGRLARGVVQLVLMLAVLTGSYAMMQRLIDARPERTPRPRPEQVVPIETVVAEATANRPTLRPFGEIVAGRALDMRAPAGGEIVRVAPGLRPGARVEAGTELVAIDDFDARTALAEARSALAEMRGQIGETEARIAAEDAQIGASEEQAQLAREDLERTDALVRRGTVPASQRDQRRIALSQAEQSVITRRANRDVQRAQLETQRGQIERLELRVEQAERAVADTVLLAPFDAVVRSTVAEIGREVTPAETLVSLYDDRDLEARFLLTDAQYGRLLTDREPLIGRPVSVTWTAGGESYAFDASIVRIGAEIASEQGGVGMFAAVEPGPASVELRPGTFVELTLPDRTFEDTFRLPETALYDERDVYVNVEGKLERRSVVRLANDGEDVIVRGAGDVPLAEGERVMATRISRVDEGLRVREPGEGADGPAERDRPGAERGGESPVASEPGRRERGLARVAEANGLTVEELRSMPEEERRALVRAYRRGAEGARAAREGG